MKEHRCQKHPNSELVKTPGCYSYECSECRTKVCLLCGSTKSMMWDSCYCMPCREARRREQAEWEVKRKQEELERKWRMEREHGEMLEALEQIAGYAQSNGCCPYGCDTPNIARQVLAKIRGDQ